MNYWGWKTLHIFMAAVLATGFLGALWPLQMWLRGGNSFVPIVALTVFFERQLKWVFPLALIQATLGMITLFSEPIRQAVWVSVLLILGTGLLALVWLIGLGLIKKSTNSLEFTRARYLIFLWLGLIGLVLLAILYLMVNLRSFY